MAHGFLSIVLFGEFCGMGVLGLSVAPKDLVIGRLLRRIQVLSQIRQ